jgi:oxygen-independent coproporphyrinogen-3 oxidase
MVGDQSMAATALYIHIPFCLRKCTYCSFNSYAGLENLHEAYVASLQREMTLASDGEGGQCARSVYIGGGTPTVLGKELLGKILSTCNDHFPLLSGAEITIEANPGTVDADLLSELLRRGVNRLSLGAQSFDDGMLSLLGRIHTVREAVDSFLLAREHAFANINLDLIYGLPNQDLDQWTGDLREALCLRPDHLSLYALSLEPGTPLFDSASRGDLPVPDPDLSALMYERAQRELARAGYIHYEISNWATPGHECQHNQTYWRNAPYLGFGAGAHSFWGGERFWNVAHPEEYVHRVQRGEQTVAAREHIGRATEMSETVILGLRLCQGVSFAEFQERFGLSLDQVFGDSMGEMVQLGLLEIDSEVMRLTARGRLLGNEVFERFLLDTVV